MASYENVTPQRSEDFTTRNKITLRDAILLAIGAATMWGTQLAGQWKTQSLLDNLGTKFESYQLKQVETVNDLQRQIDEWRQETKLNRVNTAETNKELSELKGILLGSGFRGVQKNEQR